MILKMARAKTYLSGGNFLTFIDIEKVFAEKALVVFAEAEVREPVAAAAGGVARGGEQ